MKYVIQAIKSMSEEELKEVTETIKLRKKFLKELRAIDKKEREKLLTNKK